MNKSDLCGSRTGVAGVAWLRQLFGTNQVVVFAIYGQVFFTLGVALAVQSMKHTRLVLGKHLRWLAAFGLSHGLVEWGYVFIPIQASYLPDRAVESLRWLQLGLMIASFAFLINFGLRTAMRGGPLKESVGIWSLIAMILTLVAAIGVPQEPSPEQVRTGLEIFSRYLLAVPGALASAVGVFRAAGDAKAMQVSKVDHWLKISGWSLGGYALLNLVTPEHHRMLSRYMDYDTVLQTFGVPAQVLRTLVGFGILYGMVRSLSLFEVEQDRLLMEANEKKLLEAERELSFMNQIAITLGRARDPGSAMKAVLEQFLPFLRCHGGEIALREEGATPEWRLVARAGPRTPGSRRSGPLSPLVREVASRDALVIRELEPKLYGVGIPIRGSQTLLAAAVLFKSEPVRLSPQEAQVVQSLGSLLGVAIENSRLWAEVQSKEADRTEWISRIIAAQEEERTRLSHELHDEAVQSLVLLCRELDQLEEAAPSGHAPIRVRFAKARWQAEELIGSLRNYAHDLRPPALDELGVAACLHHLLVDLSLRSGIRWEMNVTGEPRRLSRDVEIGLYRIAQEAIRNVEHHARARLVAVKIHFGPGRVDVKVSDDGQGMPPCAWQGGSAASGRLGILGMQERASLLGGKLTIDSKPGQGTTIAVSVLDGPGSGALAVKEADLPAD